MPEFEVPSTSGLRIYFDVSCLNRPFDDQRQPRIRMETEAVTLILERVDSGIWLQVSSRIVEIEVLAITDTERRRRVQALLPDKRDIVQLTPAVFRRAEALAKRGLKPADAVHLAAAESALADVLLTCDDRLCRFGDRHRKVLRVKVANPLSWLQEITDAPNA